MFGDRRPGYLPRDAHGNRRSSAGAWIVGILLLIGLGVILWFVLTRGSTSSVLTPNTQGSLSATGPRITADTGQDLFAVANDPTALTNLEDHTVAASNVNVLSVVSDQGIWVGTSQSAALFVFTGPQQSVTQVAAGDKQSMDINEIVCQVEGKDGASTGMVQAGCKRVHRRTLALGYRKGGSGSV